MEKFDRVNNKLICKTLSSATKNFKQTERTEFYFGMNVLVVGLKQ